MVSEAFSKELSRYFDAYDKWLADCLKEYNEKFEEERVLVEPGDIVEFGEDGTAYLHGSGGINYITNAVTPWEKSPHYIP